MTFSIIGTGNIAWFLASRIAAGGNHCYGVYGRDEEKVKKLADALLSDKHGGTTDIRDGDADVCILAVSDRAVGEIAKKLSFKKTLLIHTAGAVSIEAILPAATDCAVLWPVYSIVKNSFPGHRRIPCAWEASTDKAARTVQAMGHTLSDMLFEAKGEQRKWLHLAAVMSNNFITHLMSICSQICKDNGLPFSTLLPILEQTFERVKQTSPGNIQTGPAIRRDTTTLQEHTDMLAINPAWQQIYQTITTSIQEAGAAKESTPLPAETADGNEKKHQK